MAKCARCGWPMRGANSAGFRYYPDAASDRDCDQRMITAEDAEEQPGNFLNGLGLPPTWQEEILALVEEQVTAEKARRDIRAQIEGRLDLLKRLFVLGALSEPAGKERTRQAESEAGEQSPT